MGRQMVRVCAQKALIVNTKGGGHAFIGLHLAKQLKADGHSVTIFNDGDQVSDYILEAVQRLLLSAVGQ